jgi:hypothetical protein
MAMKTDRLDAIEHYNLERGGPYDPFPMQEADIRWLIAVARAAVKMHELTVVRTQWKSGSIPGELGLALGEFARVFNGEGRG